jgi:hypothetical protein
MSHTFVNENGYKVCIECGEAEDTHYWSKQDDEVFHRSEGITTKNMSLNGNWRRLLNMNLKYVKSKYTYVNNEIIHILNQLPFSVSVRKDLYTYIMSKKLTSFIEVWDTFYKVICVQDLPITTEEYIDILNSERQRKKALKMFKPIHKVESIRKYYWYITKCIEKARKILDFPYEEGQDLYKIVFNYYNLIRFKMLKSTNPIRLIENLVYYAVRDKLEPNQQVFNKTNFGLSTFCYITQLIKYLKEVKQNKLDAPLSLKLRINARNMKLYSKN